MRATAVEDVGATAAEDVGATAAEGVDRLGRQALSRESPRDTGEVLGKRNGMGNSEGEEADE